jgi:hypothetical protein
MNKKSAFIVVKDLPRNMELRMEFNVINVVIVGSNF